MLLAAGGRHGTASGGPGAGQNTWPNPPHGALPTPFLAPCPSEFLPSISRACCLAQPQHPADFGGFQDGHVCSVAPWWPWGDTKGAPGGSIPALPALPALPQPAPLGKQNRNESRKSEELCRLAT